jgi:hypothetical protein
VEFGNWLKLLGNESMEIIIIVGNIVSGENEVTYSMIVRLNFTYTNRDGNG